MKSILDYINESEDIELFEADDLLGLGDDSDDKAKEEDSKDNKKDSDDETLEDPKDDKGSKPKLDPKLKERAEIKFKIWKDNGELATWLNDNDGYQKIEYVFKDKKKGIIIDFLLGNKDGSWFLWAGKDGAINYDDSPKFDLKTNKFRDAIMNSLDKIQELIEDVRKHPDNWVQFYIK